MLGGAGGEAVRQLIKTGAGAASGGWAGAAAAAPATPEDAINSTVREAALAGAGEGVGSVVAGGINRLAVPAMRQALKPTGSMLDEYGDIGAHALKERVAPKITSGQGPRAGVGSREMGKRIGESSDVVNRALAEADARGVKIDPREVIGHAKAHLDELAKKNPERPMDIPAYAQYKAMLDDFLNKSRPEFSRDPLGRAKKRPYFQRSATQANAMKQSYQDSSRPIYRAMA
jgi:hypothetical protein